MKSFHALSFGVGIVSGMVLLLVIGGGMHLFRPSTPSYGNAQQFQGGNGGGRNMSRMAQRLGMTEADLQKEIDSGKTMQEIATEHGVTMPTGGFGRGPRSGSGAATGSGRTTNGTGAMMQRSAMMTSSSSAR